MTMQEQAKAAYSVLDEAQQQLDINKELEGVALFLSKNTFQTIRIVLERMASDAHVNRPRKTHHLETNLQKAREALEEKENALNKIVQWADAYPVEMFPEVDLKAAGEALSVAGISISALHGGWARHLTKGLGDIAREAIKDIGDKA